MRTMSNRERTAVDARLDALGRRLGALDQLLISARRSVARAHDGSPLAAPAEVDFAREHLEEIMDQAAYLAEYLTRIGRSTARPHSPRYNAGWIHPPHRPATVVEVPADQVAS